MAVTLFTALIVLLALFQVALIAGAPFGAYAWGGQHVGKLPTKLRVGSVVSLLLYVCFALVVLDRAGVLELFPVGFSRIAIWVVFGVLVLSVAANAASRSKRERLVMTPLAAALAILALIIAIGG